MAQVLEGAGRRLAPGARESGDVGPILAELCAALAPGIPRAGGDSGADGGGRARMRAIRGRAGIHALVYLARHKFGCPGLDPYNFAVSALHGVDSPALDRAIDSLEEVGRPEGMAWDGEGRFAALVSDRGGDGEWLAAAALLCLIDDVIRTRGDPPNRDDVLEEARLACGTFSKARMSGVYDDLCKMGLLGQEWWETREPEPY